MFSLSAPAPERIREFLSQQARCDYSHPSIAPLVPPPGFDVDHMHEKIGQGVEAFQKAREALQRWEQFQLVWVRAFPRETPIAPGQVVAVQARFGAIIVTNACRIISVVDEEGPSPRFGFTYGTLPGHIEMGAERFLVGYSSQEDAVYYDIWAFSRPRHWLARCGYPLVRRLQKRFVRDSFRTMRRVVATRERLPE